MTKIVVVVLDGCDNLDHYYPSVVQKYQEVKQVHHYDDSHQNYPHACCEAQALAKETSVGFVNELGVVLNNSRAAWRRRWEVLWMLHPMLPYEAAVVMFYCTKREWEGMRRKVLFYLHVIHDDSPLLLEEEV